MTNEELSVPVAVGRRTQREVIDTVVIGGGQAGLSVGYHLAMRNVPFVILDAAARVGDAWRERWDSLRLFTPARHAGLDGMPFPAPPFSFPTKDEMADYLDSYARRFALPVRSRTKVDRVSRIGQKFVVRAGGHEIEASNVVVAMARYQKPRRPAFADQLAPEIVQLHSQEYRNPSQLRPGDVLVVGAGNSGAEIALEAAQQHRTFLAGTETGHVPFRIDGLAARVVLEPLVMRVVFHRILSIATPIGRAVRPKLLRRAAPLIRTRPSDLTAANVVRVPRVAAVRDGRPLLEDGRVLDVGNVVWCTGFDAGFSFIDLPVFDADGEPRHHAGVAADIAGLYFVGLHFQYAFSSDMIHGVGRDARRIAGVIATKSSSLTDRAAAVAF